MRSPSARGLRLGLCATVLGLALINGGAAKPSSAAPGTVLQSWQATYDQAHAAYAGGDLAAADRWGRAALEQARAGGGDNHSFVASSLNLLALVRQRQGDAEAAVDLLRQALAVSERAADGHANSAALALNLGSALEALGRPAAAREAYERALAQAEQAPGAEAQATAARQQALQALARLHTALGQPEDAARYNQRLLHAEQDLPPRMQADALERQGRLQLQQGDLGAARQSFERALALQSPQQPPEPAPLLRTLGGLAAVLSRLELYDLAEPLHRRAVVLLESSAPQSTALAGHLNELGLWHLQRKEFAQAQALLERALAIVQAQAPQGLEAARMTANLAQLHEARKDDPQARALYQQALVLYEAQGEQPEALLGQAQALNYLAGQDYRRRRIALAEAQFQKALSMTEQAAGPLSPRLLPVLDNLVTLYRSQQRPAQAAPYVARAEALRAQEPTRRTR